MFHRPVRSSSARRRPRLAAAVTVAASLAIILPAAGCSSGGGDKGQVTLNYWTFMDFTQGKAGDLQKQLIADFEAANPDIKVNLIGKDAGAIITGTAAAAGQSDGPDVITTQLADGSALVYQGALLDLKSNWDAAGTEYSSQFNKDTVAMLSRDGHVWGVPYTAFATVLYRNLTVLEQAGIDPAAGIVDWTDWLDQMSKISASGNFGLANPLTSSAAKNIWIVFYAGVQGRTQFELAPDGKSTTLSVEALGEALAFIQQTRSFGSDAHMDEQDEIDLFTTNRLAYLPGGPWKDGSLSIVDGLKYDFVQVPGQVAGIHGGTRGGEFMAIPASSKHQEAAWKFLKFMTDAPNIAKFSAGVGRLVGNDQAMQDPSVSSNPLTELTFVSFPEAVNEAPLVTNLPVNITSVFVDGLAEMETAGASADPMAMAQKMVDNYNKALQ